MSLYGSFSRHKCLSELGERTQGPGGVGLETPAQRRLNALRNITGSSTITLAAVTEQAAAHQLLGGTTSAADSLVIPVTHKYVAKTTGADAEALTLANGIPGQRLTITLVTDGGGDGTLTPATASGWATAVLADAGDYVSLEYIDDTVGWVLRGHGGLTAAPVITA